MAKKKKAAEVVEGQQSSFNMELNGYKLSGVTVGGFWVWTCPDFPDLIEKHGGKDKPSPMVEAFVKRCLAALPR